MAFASRLAQSARDDGAAGRADLRRARSVGRRGAHRRRARGERAGRPAGRRGDGVDGAEHHGGPWRASRSARSWCASSSELLLSDIEIPGGEDRDDRRQRGGRVDRHRARADPGARGVGPGDASVARGGHVRRQPVRPRGDRAGAACHAADAERRRADVPGWQADPQRGRRARGGSGARREAAMRRAGQGRPSRRRRGDRRLVLRGTAPRSFACRGCRAASTSMAPAARCRRRSRRTSRRASSWSRRAVPPRRTSPRRSPRRLVRAAAPPRWCEAGGGRREGESRSRRRPRREAEAGGRERGDGRRETGDGRRRGRGRGRGGRRKREARDG